MPAFINDLLPHDSVHVLPCLESLYALCEKRLQPQNSLALMDLIHLRSSINNTLPEALVMLKEVLIEIPS